MALTLKTNLPGEVILLLHRYAPHLGYAVDEQIEYWYKIKNILTTTKKSRHFTIWATDINGQIRNDKVGPTQITTLGRGHMQNIAA